MTRSSMTHARAASCSTGITYPAARDETLPIPTAFVSAITTPARAHWQVLILPYYRDSALGDGVVGIVDVDHLNANQQKEDFVFCPLIKSTKSALVREFEKYVGRNFSNGEVRARRDEEEEDTWVLCDQCNFERLLPSGHVLTTLRWCCGDDPLPLSRCHFRRADEADPATAYGEKDVLGYGTHGSSGPSQQMVSAAAAAAPAASPEVRKGSTFVMIHAYDDPVVRFAPYVYRVEASRVSVSNSRRADG